MPRSPFCVASGTKADQKSLILEINRCAIAYLATCRNGTSGLTASVIRVLSFVILGSAGGSVNARANITPSTVVHGFLLTPEKISVGVFIEVGGDLEPSVKHDFYKLR